jgi:hypothetical protein
LTARPWSLSIAAETEEGRRGAPKTGRSQKIRRRRFCAKPPSNNHRSRLVSELTVAEATDRIYASLQANNTDIDAHIAALKAALKREEMNEAVFDPTRLAQNNRSGRKLMQAYFRQRGVSVTFSA